MLRGAHLALTLHPAFYDSLVCTQSSSSVSVIATACMCSETGDGSSSTMSVWIECAAVGQNSSVFTSCFGSALLAALNVLGGRPPSLHAQSFLGRALCALMIRPCLLSLVITQPRLPERFSELTPEALPCSWAMSLHSCSGCNAPHTVREFSLFR